MEIHEGRLDGWIDLVNAGDATSLIAVFREVLSSTPLDPSALGTISTFLEAHLFPSALEVDLPQLFSPMPTEYMEAALSETRAHALDPREILSELLAIGETLAGYALVVYLRLVRASLRQVFFDTLGRKKGLCASVEEQFSKTHEIMLAWYPGMDRLFSRIISTICQRDAAPKMVRTVNNFGHGDVDSDDVDEKEVVDLGNMPLLVEPEALQVLVLLSLDLLLMVGEPHKIMPLLLMVRTSIVAAQPYNESGEFLHRTGKDLREWANFFCTVGDKRTELKEEPYSTQNSPIVTTTKESESMREKIARAVLEISPPCELFSHLQKCWSNESTKDLMDSVTYEDNEHGKDASDARAFATLHALKKEKDSLHILSDDDYEREECNDEAFSASLSLQKIGAMLILCDFMTLEGFSDQQLLLSKSPESFFFLTGTMVLECLKSSSLNVVMTGLAFLSTLVPQVPPYSVCANGELNTKSGEIHEFGQKQSAGCTWGFHTKRFELIFEVVKSLMNISATSPCECHREVSRGIFVLLLRRFASNLRMLVYSLFLALTPFASICSLMLHSLREEWNGSQFSPNNSEFDFLQNTLPTLLLKAQKNWLSKMRFGELTFVEPMIQSINFVRCVIIEDRKRRPEDALFRFDPNCAKVQLREEDSGGGKGDRWNMYLRQLLKDVIPPLRIMVLESPETSATAMGLSGGVTLSPLDRFALSMSMDGLGEQVSLAA
ncbi:hypothetical protein TCDM_02047 [Trypanosoma cruzi Dm28c]|uniref:Uncharacterized protein n=2 Tax=Trypanosoma cruzi TaxID=5693 RepID=V5BN98_TRYCR|nr:hypothetical protein TCDM_02047 [Trypanosoma cruzi Dm28c]PBJ79293.1 hypothetical protein BCY84_03252 [Trypanosoma cruzi cruzi]PWU96388.1 hypothetical protein C4B63_19g139 [Trypanosoma cruzi]